MAVPARRLLCCASPTRRLNFVRGVVDDRAVDHQYHFIPTGRSDVSLQTQVSFVSKDMLGERDNQRICVRSLSSVGFRLIDKSFVYGPIAVFPKTVLSWRVASPNHITPESLELFFALQPKLEVLIVGAGEKWDVDGVRARIAGAISKHRIGYEILPTEDAMMSFNFLNYDYRYVAAALFPPSQISDRVTGGQHGVSMHFLRDISALDENPLLLGLHDSHTDPIKDICRRIWGQTDEGAKMEAIAKGLKKKRREEKGLYLKQRRDAKEELERGGDRKQIPDE